MDAGKMKNMVVLKDIPSNLIDEAIIILKSNKIVKSMETIKKSEEVTGKENTSKVNPKDYIINEAQLVISNYLSNLEEQKNMKYKNVKQIESKYRILKICMLFLTGLFIINATLNYFNL